MSDVGQLSSDQCVIAWFNRRLVQIQRTLSIFCHLPAFMCALRSPLDRLGGSSGDAVTGCCDGAGCQITVSHSVPMTDGLTFGWKIACGTSWGLYIGSHFPNPMSHPRWWCLGDRTAGVKYACRVTYIAVSLQRTGASDLSLPLSLSPPPNGIQWHTPSPSTQSCGE